MIEHLASILGSQTSRRAAVGLAAALGLGRALLQMGGEGIRLRPVSAHDERYASSGPIVYTDADGKELATIRVFSFENVSGRPGLATPGGHRDFLAHLRIHNSSALPLFIPSDAFALWDVNGFLYRPQDLLSELRLRIREEKRARADAVATPIAAIPTRKDADPEWLSRIWRGELRPAESIPRGGDVGRGILFRVPESATLDGLLFTPEPERMFVLVYFTDEATFIIN